MKTRFSKKLLACVMSLCMILTVCAGALSVSAAAADVTIGTVDVTAGEAEAIVPVTINADELIGGAQLYVNVPAVANIIKVDVVTAGYDVTFASGATDVTATAGTPVEAVVDEVENVANFVVIGNDNFDNIANTLVINFTFAGTFAEGTYPVTFADGTMFGTADEAAIVATVVDGAIVAAAAHVCTPADPVEENRVEADCENAGSYDEVVYCSECGEEISRTPKTIDALGHAYGDFVDNGDGTHTATCANDAAHTVTEAHTYTDGSCICGATEAPAGPIIDDTLVVAGVSPSYGTSSLYVNFRMRNTVLTKYSNMELVIIPQKYDPTTLNLVDPVEIVIPYASLSGTGTFRTYDYTDVYLYELGLDIQYMLRGTDASGNTVQSPLYSTSVASYLKNLFNSSSDELLKTLITDTLVVGAEAALTFGKEGSDLAEAPSIIEGFDISKATPSVDTYNTVDIHNATNADWGSASGTHKVAKSVTIAKVPYVNYRIRGGSSIDLDKVSFNVSYTQITGVGTTTQYNRTFTSADTANVYKSGSFLILDFAEIGLGDSNADITFTVTYDGAEVFNATYSIESYLGANTSNATIGNLATALLKLGASFRAKMA